MTRRDTAVACALGCLLAAGACAHDGGDGFGGAGQGASAGSTADGGAGGGGEALCTPGEERPCYEGPEGTQDIGLCVAGVEICLSNQSWSTCAGQVLPDVEQCNVSGDEDCDGHACSDEIWSFVAPVGGNYNEITASATDSGGNLIVAGDLRLTLNLGGNDLVSSNGTDVFLAKYASDGTHLWSKSFGGTGDQHVSGLAVDSQDNIILSGEFQTQIVFGAITVTTDVGINDSYLAKLDSNAAPLWAGHMTSHTPTFPSDTQHPHQIVVGPNDAIAVVGEYKGHWGGCSPCTDQPSITGFARMYSATPTISADGEVVADAFGNAYGTSATTGTRILSAAFAPSGGLYVAGRFSDIVDFDGTGIFVNKPGARHAYVGELDANLQGVWVFDYGDGNQAVTRLATAANGDLLIAGWFTTGITFVDSYQTTNGQMSGYVARLTSIGEPLWSQELVTTDTGAAPAIMLEEDSAGDIVVAGHFWQAMAVGPDNYGPYAGSHGYIAKFSDAGAFRWSKGYTPDASSVLAAVLGADDRIFIAGSFVGQIDFGHGPHIGPEDNNLFVAALEP